MDTNEMKVSDAELKEAASQGVYFFIKVIVEKYREFIGSELSQEKIALLNVSQNTLLAYDIFRAEMLEGGFCQLIQNGYGAYIFLNPFPKVMKMWGLDDFAKLLYRAKDIYQDHRKDLERERNDEEFMAMYEQYERLSELDDKFVDEEESVTGMIAKYVDEHIEDFVKIVKFDMQ